MKRTHFEAYYDIKSRFLRRIKFLVPYAYFHLFCKPKRPLGRKIRQLRSVAMSRQPGKSSSAAAPRAGGSDGQPATIALSHSRWSGGWSSSDSGWTGGRSSSASGWSGGWSASDSGWSGGRSSSDSGWSGGWSSHEANAMPERGTPDSEGGGTGAVLQ